MARSGMSSTLRVIPLGGLGEIGLNCLVLEHEGEAIAIDCGVMFPDATMLGVDLVIPEFDYLRNLGNRFRGFVITHGHEDHIGALPYALRELEVPVWATPMAAGLIRSRLREHGLEGSVDLRIFRPRERWDAGPFGIDPIHVTHSIVDAVGLAITTPLGVVIHTGDFKIDYTPIDGRAPDIQAFAEYGARGVLLMLSDSTNVEHTGSTSSERSVRSGLEGVFQTARRRIFFSTFSSHIHRLQQVIDLSEAADRKVVVVGRSLVNSVRIATDLGYLRAPLAIYADASELATLPAERVTVLTSGSQGEPMSALTRISMGDHSGVRMEPGDAVIGINPATDSIGQVTTLVEMLDGIISRYEIPTQSCILTHVTTTIEAINRGAPVDLVFQSIAGTEAANKSFGIDLKILQEGYEAGLSLKRGTVGDNVMYFETGQGSALSANAHHGADQQTIETRAYAVARKYKPLLINTVVGFIGPEYLYDGRQIVRAGLEDHFCGKLLGLPMGCDICYTNHAEADQNDMDILLTMLGVAGINFIMGIPGSDDVMLNYQTTSFHDALYVRRVLGLRPAPEFEAWLKAQEIFAEGDHVSLLSDVPRAFRRAIAAE